MSLAIIDVLPLEFWVPGPPISYQTRTRSQLRNWQSAVSKVALSAWPANTAPVTGRLRLTVWYFHKGESTPLDVDNLLKPIQDALNGIIYVDDRQIISVRVDKRSLDEPYFVRGVPRVLAEGLTQGEEFLYVKIDQAPDYGNLGDL